MFKQFREFALRGNVVDLAVGVIIGAAFGSIVNSLVSDIIMPPIGVLVGGVDFKDLFVVLKHGAQHVGPYESIKVAKDAGAVTLNYGVFLNTVINFLIVAGSVFLLVMGFEKLHRREQKAPAAPSRQEVLLEEIRDLLKSQRTAPPLK